MNSMRDIRIEKITLNIGCGTTLKPETAKDLLDRISGMKSVITRSHKRSTFNVPKNKPIGSKVTIRKGKEAFLKRLFEAAENKIKGSNFDKTGNFGFGIKEYINIPQMEYDPKIGILGLDVCVTLERPGYRVKRKKLQSTVGKKHVITKREAIDFVKSKFNVIIDEETHTHEKR